MRRRLLMAVMVIALLLIPVVGGLWIDSRWHHAEVLFTPRNRSTFFAQSEYGRVHLGLWLLDAEPSAAVPLVEFSRFEFNQFGFIEPPRFDTVWGYRHVTGMTLYRVTLPHWAPLLAAVAVAAAAYRRLRRMQRHHPGHCPQCNYNLTGVRSETCPECGAGIAVTHRRVHDQ
jgi:hypothetical protein